MPKMGHMLHCYCYLLLNEFLQRNSFSNDYKLAHNREVSKDHCNILTDYYIYYLPVNLPISSLASYPDLLPLNYGRSGYEATLAYSIPSGHLAPSQCPSGVMPLLLAIHFP